MMARIKHPDTFRCDLCGVETQEGVNFHGKIPVRFVSEQNEGRPTAPYVQMTELDLCPDCLDRYVTVEASGACGVNDYWWREGR